MSAAKRTKDKEARHLRLYHWMLRTPAWQGLEPVDRALYIEIAARYSGTDTRIELETNKASRAVCDRIRDGYAAAVVDVALALTKAKAAYNELVRITEDLEVNEVRWVGNLPQPQNLNLFLGNRYRDVNLSAAERFIADATAAGIITPSQLEKANG